MPLNSMDSAEALNLSIMGQLFKGVLSGKNTNLSWMKNNRTIKKR